MKKRPNSERKEINETKRLMGALLRMPPKPHQKMKLGRKRTMKPVQFGTHKKTSDH
jgi:hypothetical protein